MKTNIFTSLTAQPARVMLFSIILIISLIAACQPAAKPEASPQAKRYDLKGKVVSVDKAKKEVTISHEEIPGYMPAMTMPFPLKDEWAFDVLTSGSNVGASLVVDANSFWLEGIVISAAVGEPIASGQSGQNPSPTLGQELPSFALINQDGKSVNTQQYRGKALLLTFIYTRCPLPEYCTLMSNNFAELNKTLKTSPEMRERTHLLSITIDPAYDTPKVLRSYGAATTGEFASEKFEHWEFVTGKPEEIKRAAGFFGLNYFDDKDQITHSLRTALIAPDGKIHKIYPGNDWLPQEVYKDIQTLLGSNN